MTWTSYIAPTRRNKNDDSRKISVIILAGNCGHRMKSYGAKCLLKIGNNVTILKHTTDVIRQVLPNSEIILVTGFESDRVIKNKPDNVRIVENQLYDTTSELEQVRLALNNIVNESVLIIGSDIIFNIETIKNTDLTNSFVIFDSKDNMPIEDIGITVVENKATFFSYGIKNKWCQICYLLGKELKLLKTISADRNKSKMFLFEALNTILEKSTIGAIEPKDMSITKIDSSKDILKLNTQ